MKIYSEDGKTELGRIVGSKIVQFRLEDGTEIDIIGNDYTVLGQGKSKVSIVCEDGKINKDILPKKKEVEDGEKEEKKDDKKDDSKDDDKGGSDKSDDGKSADDDGKKDGEDDKGGGDGKSEPKSEDKGGEDKNEKDGGRKFTKL